MTLLGNRRNTEYKAQSVENYQIKMERCALTCSRHKGALSEHLRPRSTIECCFPPSVPRFLRHYCGRFNRRPRWSKGQLTGFTDRVLVQYRKVHLAFPHYQRTHTRQKPKSVQAMAAVKQLGFDFFAWRRVDFSSRTGLYECRSIVR